MASNGSSMELPGADANAEAEQTGEFSDDSSPKKATESCANFSFEDEYDRFEAAWSGAVRDINLLFTKYSQVLHEQAALDGSQIQELTNILNKAISLESELKEKKEQLKQALALISNKLQE